MQRLFHHTMVPRNKLEKLYETYNINMKTIGVGSIFNIVFTAHPIRNYRDLWLSDSMLRQSIDKQLINLGIYIKPLNRYSLSTVHTVKDIERTARAHEYALQNVLNKEQSSYNYAK